MFALPKKMHRERRSYRGQVSGKRGARVASTASGMSDLGLLWRAAIGRGLILLFVALPFEPLRGVYTFIYVVIQCLLSVTNTPGIY